VLIWCRWTKEEFFHYALQKIIPEVPIVYCYQQLGIEKLAKETTFNMIFNEANLLQLSSSLKIIRK
jgi:hypothetical protein